MLVLSLSANLLLGATTLILAVALHLAYSTIRRVYKDVTYGILTRQGGEAAWRRLGKRRIHIVFLDIDYMHQANARWGYAEVDRRIASALHIRQSDAFLMRWYSGDEVIAVIYGDGFGLAQSIQKGFQAVCMSATFGVIVDVNPSKTSIIAAVQQAAAKVQQAKNEGRRGTIN